MFQAEQYAHWHQFFENIPVSSLEFYKSLETSVADRKVPDLSSSRVEFLEGSILSAKRVYLQIQRDWMTYHICVAPFGTGFFVSSRLLVWPWKTWPVVPVIAAIIVLVLFFLFVGVTAAFNSAGIGFLVAFFFSIPGFFVLLLAIVIWFLLCRRMTYYRQDSMMAFQEAIHRLLVERINKTIEATGRRPLTEIESKPILHKLLQR